MVIVRVVIETDESSCPGDDGRDGVVESTGNWKDHSPFDEFLLIVHQEILDRNAPHLVVGEEVANVAGAAVTEAFTIRPRNDESKFEKT